jgi:hypothetical protein
MNKAECLKDLDCARKDVDKARDILAKAEEHMKELEKRIKDFDNPKPMIYLNLTAPSSITEISLKHEITHYIKHSDEYIEFEALGCTYRYLEKYETKTHTYPPKALHCSVKSYVKHVFEIYDFASKKWRSVDYIDHIELLEGVDSYDKTRK